MITDADEAEIEASRAPLLEHLIELRARLIKSLIAFVLMFFACFFFSRDIYNVLVYPYVSVVGAQNAELIATHFLEQVFTNIKLSVFGAAFLAFPVIATQIYAFVAPGPLSQRAQGVPALSRRHADLLPSRRPGGLLPGDAAADQVLGIAPAGRAWPASRRSSCCRRSTSTSR